MIGDLPTDTVTRWDRKRDQELIRKLEEADKLTKTPTAPEQPTHPACWDAADCL